MSDRKGRGMGAGDERLGGGRGRCASEGGSARCPACGRPLETIWVHGHGQCAVCGTNIAACCEGAPTDASAGVDDGAEGGERTVRRDRARRTEQSGGGGPSGGGSKNVAGEEAQGERGSG